MTLTEIGFLGHHYHVRVRKISALHITTPILPNITCWDARLILYRERTNSIRGADDWGV